MIELKVREFMEKNKMTRYRLQKLTTWNFKRVNAYYNNTVVDYSADDLDKLCEIFNCTVGDLLIFKPNPIPKKRGRPIKVKGHIKNTPTTAMP